jgi:hypothetical protein
MRLLLVALLLSGATAHAAPCLSYSGEVTLRGLLTQHTFPEQPNYESIAKGDAKATYFFISPRTHFCVAEGANSEGLEPAVEEVERVQLVFLGEKDSYGPLRPYLGKQVVCRGSLFHAISGHHHSPVLLFKAKCDAAQPIISPDLSRQAAPVR